MTDPAAPPSTEQRILRSTMASYAIQLARLGINFGAKLALARLVLPEGHGIYETRQGIGKKRVPLAFLPASCYAPPIGCRKLF